MKFMVDASTDQPLATHPISLHHDTTIVGRDYPGTLDDREVLTIAHREGRILLTNDRDFGNLGFDQMQPHAGVILLRLEESSLATKIARLEHLLTRHAADLDRVCVVTVDRVRVR